MNECLQAGKWCGSPSAFAALDLRFGAVACGAARCLTGLLELHFLLELLAKLPRHAAGPSDPTAQFRHHTRQLLWSQHDQRQDEDDEDL
jgi:hypothetical protein